MHLKQSNGDVLSKLMNEHEKQVIVSFGGLTNVVELCLTNPHASEYINTECKQFKVFNKSLKDNAQATPSQKELFSSLVQSPRGILQIVHTPKNFHQSKIVIHCDPKITHFLNLKNQRTALKAYNLILHRITLFIMICFSG